MTAFNHSTAFFLLWAALLVSFTSAAPAATAEGDLAQSQAVDLPSEAGTNRCYYNFQHYEEGDRIITNEPCLNCTCHKRMLMCYLRVCPFTKPVGQDCIVEKRPDQCCPVITCPQVPVDVLTSSTTTESASTALGHLSNYGCRLEDNTFYPDGVQMPSDPKKPCELCYCIRNHTACVRQECTLNVEGCKPIYQEGVCCPVRYDCDYNEIGTTERPSTGGLLLGSSPSPLQCHYGDTLYNDGELIVTDKPCESCYCMRGDIVCAVRSCGEPMEGTECEAVPPPEGECCPTTYQCANGTISIDSLATESSIIMHPAELITEEPAQVPAVETSSEETEKVEEPTADQVDKEEEIAEVLSPVVPVEEENKPSEEESKPSEEESRPSEEESKPSEEENKPSEEENKPSEEESKPSEEESKPSEEESKPSEDENKPSEEENKPLEEESKPTEEENKPTEEETQPEEPEKEVETHIESDPVDADEIDEEEALNPVDIEEVVDHSHLVTEAPSPVESESLVTSGPEVVPGQDESSNVEHDSQSASTGTENEETTNGPESIPSQSQETPEEAKPESSDSEASNQETTESNTSSGIVAEESHYTEHPETVETSVHSDQTETESDGQSAPTAEEAVQPNVDEKHAENESSKPEHELSAVEEHSSETEATPPKEVSSDSQETPVVANSNVPEESSTNKVEQAEDVVNENENISVQESTNPSIQGSPESLDQIKESEAEKDTSVPAHDVVEGDNPSQEPVISESSTDLTEPEKPSENETFVREPVPPRKDDAVPEEPEQIPQHPEGSMTKAEDSDPSNVNTPVGAENVQVSENNDETATSSNTNIAENEEVKPEHDDSANEELPEVNPPKDVFESIGEVSDVQTEQTMPEVVSENAEPTQDVSNENIEPSHDGDSNESEATTDSLEPIKEQEGEESTTVLAEGDAVPSIIVTENESSIVPDNVSEDKDENHSSVQISQDSVNAVDDDAPASETEKPAITIEEHNSESQQENSETDVGPANEESTAVPMHEEESQKPVETSNDNSDSESATKENEITKDSEEVTSSIKEDETMSSVTEKVELPGSGQHHDETESSENEVNPEHPHEQPNEVTEPQTNEESSTDPLVKVGDSQPDSVVIEHAPEESKPVETPTETHGDTPSGGTETNEFQEVEHDPVEQDPTDFEEQEEPIQQIHEEPSSENEIIDDNHSGHGGSLEHKPYVPVSGPMGIIPGEGDCLVDGITYTNNSVIPSKSPCHKECTCMSSIVHCQGIDCPPPPPQLANCMPVHQGDLCCPVYTCDGNTAEGPESHNQMGAVDEVSAEAEVPATEIPEQHQEHDAAEVPTQGLEEEEAKPIETAEVANQGMEVEEAKPAETADAGNQGMDVEEEKPAETTDAGNQGMDVEEEKPAETTEQPIDHVSQTVQPALSDNIQTDEAENTPEDNSQQSEASTEIPSVPAEETVSPVKEEAPNSNPTPAESAIEQHAEDTHSDNVPATDSEIKPGLITENQQPHQEEASEEQTPSATLEPSAVDEGATVKPENDGVETEEESDQHVVSPGEAETHQTEPESNQVPEVEQPVATDAPKEQEETTEVAENEVPAPENVSHDIEESANIGPDNSEGTHSSEDLPSVEEEASNKGTEAPTEINTEAPVVSGPSSDSSDSVENAEVAKPNEENVSEVHNEEVPSTEEDLQTAQPTIDEEVSPEASSENLTSAPETSEHDVVEQSHDGVEEGEVTNSDTQGQDSQSTTDEEIKHDEIKPQVEVDADQSSVAATDKPAEEDTNSVTEEEIKPVEHGESDDSSSTPDEVVTEISHGEQNELPSEPSNEEKEEIPVTITPQTDENVEAQPSEAAIPEEPKPSEAASDDQTAHDSTPEEHSENAPQSTPDISTGDTQPIDEVASVEHETPVPLEAESTEVPQVVSSEPEAVHDTIEESQTHDEEKPQEVHQEVNSELSSQEPILESDVSTKGPETIEPLDVSTEVYENKVPSPESDDLIANQEETHKPDSSQETVTQEENKNTLEESTSGNEDQPQETKPNTSAQEPTESEEESPEVAPIEQHTPEHDVVSENENPTDEVRPSVEQSEPSSTQSSETLVEESKPAEQETEQTPHDVEETVAGVEEDKPAQESSEPVETEEHQSEEVNPPQQIVTELPHPEVAHGEETIEQETEAPAHDSEKPTEEHTAEVAGGESVHQEEADPAVENQNQQIVQESSTHQEESSPEIEHQPEPEQPAQEVVHETETPENPLPQGNIPLEEDSKPEPSTPIDPELPSEEHFPSGADMDYDMNEDGAFGPGTCRYGGKVYVSAQQIPRDDPCDFCFCFRSDIICLQQSCPPPIHRCHQEPIQGYCCPRYQCPVSMATSLNLTTTTTTTTTTLPPHFFAHAYQGAARQAGCLHKGRAYSVGEEITSASGPCLQCICGADGQMKCDPVVCSPEPMLRKMMEAAVSHRRR